MYKKILVATDASENSRHALSTAIEYAKQFKSEIILLYVFNQLRPIVSAAGEDFIGSYTEEQINDFSGEILDMAVKGMDIGNIKIERKIVQGYPSIKIIEEVKGDSDIGLIVMGTRGHGPLTGAIIGSVAQRVLANSPCPVLIVK
ncbi:MAG: universal stress protein [Oscillospiraceae bacterium]